MHILRRIVYFLGFVFWTGLSFAQDESVRSEELPQVFIIGEFEHDYEKMVLECDDHLLSVCDGSMDMAYNVWLHMISNLEQFASEKSFDINGTKLWLTAYWNKDGTIKHLVYYPKPNSKNMDFQKLTGFFTEFTGVYKLPLESESCFSHYGSATFPSFANHYFKQSKK